MPAPHPLSPESFLLEGGEVGVLLLHGFTGAPPEMRLIGDYLHERGLTVSGPRLPGHGTSPEDLNTRRWPEWTGCAEEALAALEPRCERVFVGGLSMGSLLTLYLGSEHPELAGLVCYSPALKLSAPLIHLAPLASRVLTTFGGRRADDLVDPEARARVWCYDRRPVRASAELLFLIREVRDRLPRVEQDLLVIQSTGDRAIHRRAGPLVLEGVASADKELVWLHHSGHNLCVDGEWVTAAERTWRFVEQRSS